MPLHPPVKSPNIEKLFNYLQKSQWHNVSASFSGFVRKEFEEDLTKLEEDEGMYRDLKLMIEYAEMGRFSEARNLMDPAFKEYQAILHNLDELHLTKSARQRAQYTDRSHMEQVPPTNRQEVYSPEKRPPPTPKQMSNPGYMSPQRQPMYPSRQHQDLPQEREKTESPSPQYRQEQQNSYDIHRENYDGLRLKSPEKQPYSQSSRLPTPNDRPSRPSSHKSDKGSEPGHYNSNNQMASSKALWGREHGDKPSEKIGSSTYRQEFKKIPMENNERVDRDKYRENFGSLAERDIYRSDADDRIGSSESARRPGHHMRHPETPDYDQRPSELARKFKLLFDNEWKDAYDEVCGFYAKSSQSAREKTARHLLWIVTEAALIANDVAERQLRDLEQHALDVMTTPGYNDEAWLINDDVAEKQLKDIEKATLGLMTTPGPEHHVGGYPPRNLGDTIPTSRNLLLKYRKQTAVLSIPYIKQECREKITRTLLESSRFPKSFFADSSRLVAYIHKCAELTWMMCVHDPPIVLEYITKETEGSRFNFDHYIVHEQSGTTYDYGVWPILRLGKKGQILSKGYAKGI